MSGHRPFRELARSLPQPEVLCASKRLTVERTRYKRGTVYEARFRLGRVWSNITLGTLHFSFTVGMQS